MTSPLPSTTECCCCSNSSNSGASALLAVTGSVTGGPLVPWWPDETPIFRAVLIILYGSVCAGCVIGNLLVLLVIVCHRKMRSDVNMLLSNLAVADLCVGVFCVIPNLFLYISHQRWLIGQVMCKLFYFVKSLNYSCSICILTVISLERYLAINHPMLNRRHFSRTRLLRVAVVSSVWLTCVIYSLPLLVGYNVKPAQQAEIGNRTADDVDHVTSIPDTYCVNSMPPMMNNVYVMVDFLLLYIAPLSLMTFVYAKISIVLWQTSGSHSSGTTQTTSVNHVQLASICRSLSEDARRTRTVRGGSLHNPSNLHVPPSASGVCSSATESSGSQIGEQLLGTSGHRVAAEDSSRGSRLRHQQLTVGKRSCSAAMMCRVHWEELVTSERNTRRKSESSMLPKAVLSTGQYAGNVVNALVDIDVRPTVVVIDKWDKDDVAVSTGTSGRHHHAAGGGLHGNFQRFSPMTRHLLRNHNHRSMPNHNKRMLSYDDIARASPLYKRSPLVSGLPSQQRNSTVSTSSSSHQQTPLNNRRRVIRLLIVFVVSFAVCMLPHHLRLQWQLWFNVTNFSDVDIILPPLTTLMFYANSCFNPFLYALISDKFRKAVADVCCTLCRKHQRWRQRQKQQWISVAAAAVAKPPAIAVFERRIL